MLPDWLEKHPQWLRKWRNVQGALPGACCVRSPPEDSDGCKHRQNCDSALQWMTYRRGCCHYFRDICLKSIRKSHQRPFIWIRDNKCEWCWIKSSECHPVSGNDWIDPCFVSCLWLAQVRAMTPSCTSSHCHFHVCHTLAKHMNIFV